MIYFDNSATTRTKPAQVINALLLGATKYSANPGRSGHNLSIATAEKIAEVRQQLQSHFNAKTPENVVFTQNCTESLNVGILGTAKQGGHVICTDNEHNSVMRPLEQLKQRGIITYSIAKTINGKITAKQIDALKKSNTYLVITNHISNVNGDEADIEEIGAYCKKHRLLYLVDGAQSCGHKEIDVQKCGINILAIAGHKGLYACQGAGVMIINDCVPKPIKFGGTGTNSSALIQPLVSPECYETGTINVPAILSLSEGVKFVEANAEAINNKIEKLTTYFLSELEKIDGIKMYTHNSKNGVIAFNYLQYDSSELSDYLNTKNICVRSGLHCAYVKHKSLNTISQGVIRASLSYYNEINEIDSLILAIKTF